MWMLVRGNAIEPDQDGSLTLAACPDSAERGDQWLWSVRQVPARAPASDESSDGPAQAWRLAVDHDPEHITTETTVHVDEAVDLTRAPGEEMVVVPLTGQHLVTHATGPWKRWVAPGDVFIVEGEETEQLRLTPAPGGARVALIRLRPTSARALRWVP